MHLHFGVEVAPDTGSGVVDVSASSDSRSSDLVELRIGRVANVIHLSWNKVGLIHGTATRSVVGRRVKLEDQNIMVLAGVRPGENYLQYQVEAFGQARLRRIVVYPDSGISKSSQGPGTLRLHVSAKPGPRLRVGQILHVTMNVTDPQARPVRAVTAGLSYDRKAFRLLNPPPLIQLPVVSRSHPYRRIFDLRVLAVGKPTIEVGAQSVNASPEATITPTVRAGPAGFQWSLWTPLAGVALGAALIIAGRRIRTGARS